MYVNGMGPVRKLLVLWCVNLSLSFSKSGQHLPGSPYKNRDSYYNRLNVKSMYYINCKLSDKLKVGKSHHEYYGIRGDVYR